MMNDEASQASSGTETDPPKDKPGKNDEKEDIALRSDPTRVTKDTLQLNINQIVGFPKESSSVDVQPEEQDPILKALRKGTEKCFPDVRHMWPETFQQNYRQVLHRRNFIVIISPDNNTNLALAVHLLQGMGTLHITSFKGMECNKHQIDDFFRLDEFEEFDGMVGRIIDGTSSESFLENLHLGDPVRQEIITTRLNNKRRYVVCLDSPAHWKRYYRTLPLIDAPVWHVDFIPFLLERFAGEPRPDLAGRIASLRHSEQWPADETDQHRKLKDLENLNNLIKELEQCEQRARSVPSVSAVSFRKPWHNPLEEDTFDLPIRLAVCYVAVHFPEVPTSDFDFLVGDLLQEEDLQRPSVQGKKGKKSGEDSIVVAARDVWARQADAFMQRCGLIEEGDNGRRVITFTDSTAAGQLVDYLHRNHPVLISRYFMRIHQKGWYLFLLSHLAADHMIRLYRERFLTVGTDQVMTILMELLPREEETKLENRILDRLFALFKDMDDQKPLRGILRERFLPFLANSGDHQHLMLRLFVRYGGLPPLELGEDLAWLRPLLVQSNNPMRRSCRFHLFHFLARDREHFLATISKIGKWLPARTSVPQSNPPGEQKLFALLWKYAFFSIRHDFSTSGSLPPALYLLDPQYGNDTTLRLIHDWLRDGHMGFAVTETNHLYQLAKFLQVLLGIKDEEKIFAPLNEELGRVLRVQEITQRLGHHDAITSEMVLVLLLTLGTLMANQSKTPMLDMILMMMRKTGVKTGVGGDLEFDHVAVFRLGLGVMLVEWHHMIFFPASGENHADRHGAGEQLDALLTLFHRSSDRTTDDWLHPIFLLCRDILSQYIASLTLAPEKQVAQARWRSVRALVQRDMRIIRNSHNSTPKGLLVSLLTAGNTVR